MSDIVPKKDTDFLAWIAQHETVWSDAYQSIGLSEQDATKFAASVRGTEQYWANWLNARQAAKDAARDWREAKSSTRTLASASIRKIKTFAAGAADPAGVYSAAQLPQPKVPSFGTPPGTPTNVRVELDTVTGNLTLRFDCNNPKGLAGTVYTVQRRGGTSGAWTQVGITSVRSFVDTTLIAGSAAVQYQITAFRGSVAGEPSGPVTVTFGRQGPGAGEVFARVERAPKLAA